MSLQWSWPRMLPERSLGIQEGLPTKKPKEPGASDRNVSQLWRPRVQIGLALLSWVCWRRESRLPRPRAPSILLGGTSDQSSLTWPWHMAQVGQDRLTLVVCVGTEEWDEWTRWTSPL